MIKIVHCAQDLGEQLRFNVKLRLCHCVEENSGNLGKGDSHQRAHGLRHAGTFAGPSWSAPATHRVLRCLPPCAPPGAAA